MAGRKSGRRGGGRIGGRTGGRNGWRGRTPACQEYSEEGSVHTEPTISVHGTEQTQVEEQPFTFEPEVIAAIAREFTELMKVSLPGLLAKALKKVNEMGGSNTAVDTPNTEEINAPLDRGCDYKSFKAFVKFAANSLREEASHWWEGVRQAKGSEVVDAMMWADLKTLVIKNFSPRNEIEKVEREFLGLKAWSMTHRQYTTRFNELARLVPHLVTTEERKTACYIQGLPDQVRTYVKANAPTTYDSVVELSGVGLIYALNAARPDTIPDYSREGFKCYNCGESGHMSRECTKPRMGESGKGKGPEKREERPRAKT
ncbi:hypothetical protein L1987_54670 [Smallanthus sonchifolius]|uniref:Uncharacterized protein n=1 Tax=Smallanthus sonchifolius TaxID=185202 RepID=A0ACB9E8F9_9ASTR|nr:hypothetical protein L1987_54670 [Smallanthus sonchifolius]